MFDHYGDVELVSKLQDFLLILKTGFNKAGMPQYDKGCTESQEVCEQAIIYCDLIVKELENRWAMYDTEHTAFASAVVEAVLTQRFHDDNNRKEWALVSKKPDKKTGKRRVLYWFGTKKPSEEEFKEQERRVQYFKHKE